MASQPVTSKATKIGKVVRNHATRRICVQDAPPRGRTARCVCGPPAAAGTRVEVVIPRGLRHAGGDAQISGHRPGNRARGGPCIVRSSRRADGLPARRQGRRERAGSRRRRDNPGAADAAANVPDVGAPADGEGAGVMPSPPGTYACPSGGCNATGGACTAAGQVCQCTKDGDCRSGRCVKATGRNDVSCGASCTGTGAADGFGCALGATSIPAACTTSFAYTPSNFAPDSYAPPATVTTIGCNTTYSSSAHAFTSFCSGATAPTIYANVAQPGGPIVDVLAFRGLTLDSGSTLILTGSNPVILAVYGDATIAGVIDASAQGGGGGGAGATACAAGASGGGTPGPAAGAGSNPGPSGGGGGGLAVAGAADYPTYTNPSGNATNGIDNVGASGGDAHGNATVVPLVGGCSGGNGADGNSGNAGGTGGVGGGGVQLAVAGTVSGCHGIGPLDERPPFHAEIYPFTEDAPGARDLRKRVFASPCLARPSYDRHPLGRARFCRQASLTRAGPRHDSRTRRHSRAIEVDAVSRTISSRNVVRSPAPSRRRHACPL